MPGPDALRAKRIPSFVTCGAPVALRDNVFIFYFSKAELGRRNAGVHALEKPSRRGSATRQGLLPRGRPSMKLSLVVLAPEKMRGRVIPVSRSPFLIGRDPECYLRPSSSTVSLRHCTIRLREGRVSIEDLDSTNGTLVNERRIKGEIELLNGDRLTIGPLVLELRLQVGTPVTEATPLPPTRSNSEASDDEAAAAVLLSTDGEKDSPHGAKPRFPLGDTEIIHFPPAEGMTPAPHSDGLPFGSSGVAKELLKQYRRRARPDK
jgi:hypothetical protein